MKIQSLHDRLSGTIAGSLKKKLGRDNVFSLPRISKVTVNVGINKTKMDSKEIHEYVEECIKIITGQKPVFRASRLSISNFKTREGSIVGAMVTLRGKQMMSFLDKLIHVALPRVRDFRGLNTHFDGHGNYSIGIREHTIFPEVPPPEASKVFGFQVTITTTTDSDEEAEVLLREIGVPFRREKPADNS
jgi:large subunit ribosomal protein L5